MRILIQRVLSASVKVNSKTISSIDKGLLVFVGISKDISQDKIEYLTNKILKYKLWPDEDKNFKKNIVDIDGQILIVSQFTLYGDLSSSLKPNFSKALNSCESKEFYDLFVKSLKSKYPKIKQGQFGAMMEVSLVNDGPVTFFVEK